MFGGQGEAELAASAYIISEAGGAGVGAGAVGGEEEAVFADGAVLLVGLAALDAVGDGVMREHG